MRQVNKKRICIIGAGIAGLTAAALLSKKGYRVTVYEKESVLGGRALSVSADTLTKEKYTRLLSDYHSFIAFSKPDLQTIIDQRLLDGYLLDLGYHAIGGGVLSNLNEVLKEFDEHVDFLESYVGFIDEGGYRFPFLSKIDKLKILPNILRLLFASEKTLKKLDDVSISETIKQYGKGNMKLILEIFSRSITTVNNLDRVSTGEMFRAQRNLYRGSKPVGYPKGGLGVIHEKLSDIIKTYGGSIRLNAAVNHININQGKAVSVQIEDDVVFYDYIIYSGLLQSLFNYSDESAFPKLYVKTIKNLTGTGSLSGYYSLSDVPNELIGKTFHFIERNVGVDGNDAVGMIDFMAAAPEASISPSHAKLVQAYIICTPEEAKQKKVLQRLRQILDKNLARLIPDYDQRLNWALYPSVWHLDGVAKTIDNSKPSIETPIQNLYVIGDGVKAMGIGFNCALNSARLLANQFG
ncbi:MAG TPA: FAD-dependent oxidoreductase [Candidatus Thermoplasmatota archaeon]|nr:FAD-dependent oxidoreductase [Candidatus Thermoplasmatota archaeon]